MTIACELLGENLLVSLQGQLNSSNVSQTRSQATGLLA